MKSKLRCKHCGFVGKIETRQRLSDGNLSVGTTKLDCCRLNPPVIHDILEKVGSIVRIIPQSGWPIVDTSKDWCAKLKHGTLVITKNKEYEKPNVLGKSNQRTFTPQTEKGYIVDPTKPRPPADE